MLEIILLLLLGLWVLGIVRIPGFTIPDLVMLRVNGHNITLLNVIVFVLIIWAIDLLPRPFKEIAGILLLLWILSILGILAIAGLQNILEVALIVGLVYYVIFERKK